MRIHYNIHILYIIFVSKNICEMTYWCYYQLWKSLRIQCLFLIIIFNVKLIRVFIISLILLYLAIDSLVESKLKYSGDNISIWKQEIRKIEHPKPFSPSLPSTRFLFSSLSSLDLSYQDQKKVHPSLLLQIVY